MPEIPAQSSVKKTKLCVKCRTDLKEVMSGFNVMSQPIIYCHNDKCDRFGLVTAIWIAHIVNEQGMYTEAVVKGGIEIR